GGRKFVPQIVHQGIHSFVGVFLGDGHHLIEIALDGGFDRAVPLDGFQVEHIEQDEGGSRQHHRQLQQQHRASALVPSRFLHGNLCAAVRLHGHERYSNCSRRVSTQRKTK